MKYLVRTGSMKRFSRLSFLKKALLRSWRNEGIQRSFRSDPFILRIIYTISLTKTNVPDVKFCCSELVGSRIQSGVKSDYQLLYKYNNEVHLSSYCTSTTLRFTSNSDYRLLYKYHTEVHQSRVVAAAEIGVAAIVTKVRKMCFSQMQRTTLIIVRTACFSVHF